MSDSCHGNYVDNYALTPGFSSNRIFRAEWSEFILVNINLH